MSSTPTKRAINMDSVMHHSRSTTLVFLACCTNQIFHYVTKGRKLLYSLKCAGSLDHSSNWHFSTKFYLNLDNKYVDNL